MLTKSDLFIINLLILLFIFDFTILGYIVSAAYLITKIEAYFMGMHETRKEWKRRYYKRLYEIKYQNKKEGNKNGNT